MGHTDRDLAIKLLRDEINKQDGEPVTAEQVEYWVGSDATVFKIVADYLRNPPFKSDILDISEDFTMKLSDIHVGGSMSVDSSNILAVVSRLKYLSNNGKKGLRKTTGICYDITTNTGQVLGWEVFRAVGATIDWYTGNPNYPVPDTPEVGDWDGISGKRRRQLCRELVKFLVSTEDYKEATENKS